MGLRRRIEERMRFSKRQLATLDQLEENVTHRYRISEIYHTIENDLTELGYKQVRALEYLRSGRLYDVLLTGENNFRHCSNKRQLFHIDEQAFSTLNIQDKVTRDGISYFPFHSTMLLDNCLLGVICVDKGLKRNDNHLLKEYARSIGMELSPRYYRKEKDRQLRQKSEELSRLMGDAIHEVRGKLNPIISYASLLSSIVKGSEKISAWSDKIYSLTLKASEELDYFQQVFREGPENKTPANLYEIIEGVVEDNRSFAVKKKIGNIQNHLEPARYIANVEATAMRLSFHELLNNAIKYSRPQGVISISGEQEKNRWRIIFRNTSPEISSDELPFIFERGKGKGTGLGLSFVRRVIEEEHHGKVTVDCRDNEFILCIELPMNS